MQTLVARLSSKIVLGDGGCWEWTASLRDGYGQIRSGDSVRQAHRVLYELVVGPVPVHLDLDHLCRNRSCVNPAHMEIVTRRENLLRSPITSTAAHAENRDCGGRRCRNCQRFRTAA